MYRSAKKKIASKVKKGSKKIKTYGSKQPQGDIRH